MRLFSLFNKSRSEAKTLDIVRDTLTKIMMSSIKNIDNNMALNTLIPEPLDQKIFINILSEKFPLISWSNEDNPIFISTQSIHEISETIDNQLELLSKSDKVTVGVLRAVSRAVDIDENTLFNMMKLKDIKLGNDLGCDSVDEVEVVMNVEHEFKLPLEDNDILEETLTINRLINLVKAQQKAQAKIANTPELNG